VAGAGQMKAPRMNSSCPENEEIFIFTRPTFTDWTGAYLWSREADIAPIT
jgi:hypothetical protein